MTEEWVITPGEGVGPIQFDMTPDEVANALAARPGHVEVHGEDIQHSFSNGVRVYWRGPRMLYVELFLEGAEVSWALRGVTFVGDAREQGRRLSSVGLQLIDESGPGGFYTRIDGTPVYFWMDDDRSGVLDTAIVESPDGT